MNEQKKARPFEIGDLIIIKETLDTHCVDNVIYREAIVSAVYLDGIFYILNGVSIYISIHATMTKL